MTRACLVAFSLSVLFSGCAKADFSPNREAYILAHPHGWMELTVTDKNIPPAPPEKGADSKLVVPPNCLVAVTINRESVLNESIFPSGQVAPLAVETGFRVAVPQGVGQLELAYLGCRPEVDGKPATYRTEINVEEGKVIPLVFDGSSITVAPAQDNTVTTLEDIAGMLKELRKNQGAAH